MIEVTNQLPLVPNWFLWGCFIATVVGLVAVMRDQHAYDQKLLSWLGSAALAGGLVVGIACVTYNFAVCAAQLSDHLQLQSYDAYPQR